MSRTDLELEQLLVGELPESLASGLREELRTNPGLAAQYQALIDSNVETLARFPPQLVALEVERRRSAQLPAQTPSWRPAIPALVAIAVAIVAGVWLREAPDGTRVKGLEPVLHVYRDRGGTAEELQPNARVRAGDRVQLRYASAGAPWGVLLSIDGRGGVTMHFPLEKAAAPALETGPTNLPRALELDDAPLFERFIFVTCQTRPDVERVISAARSLANQPAARIAPLALEPGCSRQTSFVLSKELR